MVLPFISDLTNVNTFENIIVVKFIIEIQTSRRYHYTSGSIFGKLRYY